MMEVTMRSTAGCPIAVMQPEASGGGARSAPLLPLVPPLVLARAPFPSFLLTASSETSAPPSLLRYRWPAGAVRLTP